MQKSAKRLVPQYKNDDRYGDVIENYCRILGVSLRKVQMDEWVKLGLISQGHEGKFFRIRIKVTKEIRKQ